jgi:hypothetical protein
MQGEKGSATFPSLSKAGPELPGSATDPSTARARDRSVRRWRGTVQGRLRAHCLAVPHPARPASAACLALAGARGTWRTGRAVLVTGPECRQRIAAKPSENCTLSRRASRGNHACGRCCRPASALSALLWPFSTGHAQVLMRAYKSLQRRSAS